MILLFLVFLALLKAIADTLKIPQVFESSIFYKYKGNSFIDPTSSYIKVSKYPKWKRLLTGSFYDLCHLVSSLYIITFLFLAVYFSRLFSFELVGYIQVLIYYIAHGFFFEIFYNSFKRI